MAFNGTRQDMGRSLVDPIARSIVDKGGKILTEVAVSNIHWNQGKIESLTYQKGNEAATVPFG